MERVIKTKGDTWERLRREIPLKGQQKTARQGGHFVWAWAATSLRSQGTFPVRKVIMFEYTQKITTLGEAASRTGLSRAVCWEQPPRRHRGSGEAAYAEIEPPSSAFQIWTDIS